MAVNTDPRCPRCGGYFAHFGSDHAVTCGSASVVTSPLPSLPPEPRETAPPTSDEVRANAGNSSADIVSRLESYGFHSDEWPMANCDDWGKLKALITQKEAEIERMKRAVASSGASAAEAWLYSTAWMGLHDQLMGWIQNRPDVFKEFYGSDPRGPFPSPERIQATSKDLQERLSAAESEIERLRCESHFSNNGLNIRGNRESIDAAVQAFETAAMLPAIRDRLAAAESRIAADGRELEGLRKALKPLAKLADKYDLAANNIEWPNSQSLHIAHTSLNCGECTVGDLRRARAALKEKP